MRSILLVTPYCILPIFLQNDNNSSYRQEVLREVQCS